MHIRCPHCQNPIEVIDDLSSLCVFCPSCGSSFDLAPPDTVAQSTLPTSTVGRFELLDELGSGAFGTVWKARDTRLDRIVAFKIPRATRLDAAAAEQFLREARAAAQLRHPNIVGVHEVGREGNTLYIVSQYVQGVTLSDWLTGQRPTPREAAELCAKLALALQHAHDQGVIHRDLKPSNVILDAQGEPHVMDFGLAKREAGEITMTMDGKILGTPAYMSPEQARGEAHSADARSDVYALGVLLFESLTGERPFRGNTRMLIHQVLHDEAPSPRKLNGHVPKDLETICLKCLQKQPDKRYQTAKELSEDLRRFLESRPIVARPVGAVERGWRWCRRRPWAASLLTVSFLAAAAAFVYLQTRPAYLDVRVSPADARVTLDGERVEMLQGRALIARAPGRYLLSAEKEGYVGFEKQVVLARGEANAVIESLDLPRNSGFLRVDESDPPGADVSVLDARGEVFARGRTPFHSPPLTAGQYRVVQEKELYAAAEVVVNVPSGDRLAQVPSTTLQPRFEGSVSLQRLREVRKLLDQTVSTRADNQPLRDFVSYLNNVAQGRLLIDSRALASEGLDETVLVSCDLANAPLRAILDEALRNVGLSYTSSLHNSPAEITITTRRAAEHPNLSVLYPVAELLSQRPLPELQSLDNTIRSAVAPFSWSHMGSWSVGDAAPPIGPEGAPVQRGTIQLLDGKTILVVQSLAVHEELDDFLLNLRSVSADQRGDSAAGAQPLPTTVDRLRAASKKLAARPGQPLDGAFSALPLPDVLRRLSAAYGVRFQVDYNLLGGAGVGKDTAVTARIAPDASLREALSEVLGPLKLSFAPTLRSPDQTIVVTTGEWSSMAGEFVLYPVADLFPADDESIDVRGLQLLVQRRFEQFAMVREAERVLIVSAPFAAHERIDAFLAELRRGVEGGAEDYLSAFECQTAADFEARALAYFQRGNQRRAVDDLTAALAADNPPIVCHRARGLIRIALGEYEGGVADLEQFLSAVSELQAANRAANPVQAPAAPPNADPVTVTALAYVLATCPDGDVRNPARAAELVRTLVTVQFENRLGGHEVLAAVAAVRGDFDSAAKYQRQVVPPPPPWHNDPQVAESAAEKLALYEAGKLFLGKPHLYVLDRPFPFHPQPTGWPGW